MKAILLLLLCSGLCILTYAMSIAEEVQIDVLLSEMADKMELSINRGDSSLWLQLYKPVEAVVEDAGIDVQFHDRFRAKVSRFHKDESDNFGSLMKKLEDKYIDKFDLKIEESNVLGESAEGDRISYSARFKFHAKSGRASYVVTGIEIGDGKLQLTRPGKWTVVRDRNYQLTPAQKKAEDEKSQKRYVISLLGEYRSIMRRYKNKHGYDLDVNGVNEYGYLTSGNGQIIHVGYKGSEMEMLSEVKVYESYEMVVYLQVDEHRFLNKDEFGASSNFRKSASYRELSYILFLSDKNLDRAYLLLPDGDIKVSSKKNMMTWEQTRNGDLNEEGGHPKNLLNGPDWVLVDRR